MADPHHGRDFATAGDRRKTVTLTSSCYAGDIELLEQMQAFLGCSRSEVMRTAIRLLAAHLAFTSEFKLER